MYLRASWPCLAKAAGRARGKMMPGCQSVQPAHSVTAPSCGVCGAALPRPAISAHTSRWP